MASLPPLSLLPTLSFKLNSFPPPRPGVYPPCVYKEQSFPCSAPSLADKQAELGWFLVALSPALAAVVLSCCRVRPSSLRMQDGDGTHGARSMGSFSPPWQAARQDRQVWWVAWKRKREGKVGPSIPCRQSPDPSLLLLRALGPSPAIPSLCPQGRCPHQPRSLLGGFAGLPVTPLFPWRRTMGSRAPGPGSLCLGPYFTGEQIPIGRVAAENQELKAILNELSK